MPTIHPQVVERTGDFHGQIRKACFGVAKDLFHNPTPLDARNGIFHKYARPGNQAIEPFFCLTERFAFWLFFGWKVKTAVGS